MKLPKNIIIMKVGPHSGMSLEDIINSKIEEEKRHGVHFWGYSGVFCQPKPTKKFCEKCNGEMGVPPTLILMSTKSAYNSNVGMINDYSVDGISYTKFKYPVQLQGAEFSFVAKNLRKLENFNLADYEVVESNDKIYSFIQAVKNIPFH